MANFQTFQIPQNYEDALARHGQWVRWVNGIVCPCLNTATMQPDVYCLLCKGRGRIYRFPGKFQLLDEKANHDHTGKVYPLYTPYVSGSAKVYRKGVELTLAGGQPSDLSYIQLDPPYPKSWEALTLDYEWDSSISVVSENSQVLTTNTLKTIATRFEDRGKTFEGSIQSVSRVYNVTRIETYTVSAAYKEYIYLENMGTWQSGDILEVDYVYQRPFNFLLIGVSPKVRWESPYVLEDASATLVTPYWAQVGPDDLFTALAQEQQGKAVVDPSVTPGNDEINHYFDVSRLTFLIDKNGVEYSLGPGNNVEIFERNQIKWNIPKPSVSYTVHFTYHPTYAALPEMHTLRNAENKAFVNRVGVKLFDRVHEEVNF